MYRVLVPFDSSERRAAAQAQAVTALPNAGDAVTAILLYVYDDGVDVESGSVTQLSSGRLLADELGDADVDVETVTRRGDPADAILDVAGDRNVDVIVLGGRKRSSVGKLLFGSVSQSVLSRADRPVTVTGEDE
jgi:nucleotide-binding universal stress UspA family protein